jgi:hypothetical protein
MRTRQLAHHDFCLVAKKRIARLAHPDYVSHHPPSIVDTRTLLSLLARRYFCSCMVHQVDNVGWVVFCKYSEQLWQISKIRPWPLPNSAATRIIVGIQEVRILKKLGGDLVVLIK